MRGFFTRIVGGLARLDPVEHLGDPDEVPEPDTAPDGRAGMSPPVDAETVRRLHEGLKAWNPDAPAAEAADREAAPEVVTERLDVEPELRPWDTVQAPARQPVPRPGVRIVKVPHCDGRHGEAIDQVARRRCEWCDALTDVITVVRHLEREVTEKDRRIADLERRLYALDGESR